VNRGLAGGYVPAVTNVDIWIHETRRCGVAALTLPLLGTAGIAAMSVAVAAAQAAGREGVGEGMVRLVALVFPIAPGLGAVAAIGRERMTEFHASLPTPYPTTVLRRLLVLAAVTVLIAAILVGTLIARDQWEHPATGLPALLVPLGPAFMLTGTGVWAVARLRSMAAASAIVIGAWLAEVFFLDRLIGVWQVNRITLAAIGVAFAVLALRRLHGLEDLVYGGNE
jgi:hypothetical protein